MSALETRDYRESEGDWQNTSPDYQPVSGACAAGGLPSRSQAASAPTLPVAFERDAAVISTTVGKTAF